MPNLYDVWTHESNDRSAIIVGVWAMLRLHTMQLVRVLIR